MARAGFRDLVMNIDGWIPLNDFWGLSWHAMAQAGFWVFVIILFTVEGKITTFTKPAG